MNLWIRTQDKKTLMLVNTICLAEDEVGTIIGCGIDIRVKLSIGKYKTKERALEVLDEIQNILRPKYILDSSSIKEHGNSWVENGVIMQEYNANATIQELSTYVYEMPKE